jgi:hypothetical protein
MQLSRLPTGSTKDIKFIKVLASVLHVPTQFGIVRALKLADRMQGENFAADVRPAAMARMYQSHFFRALLNEARTADASTTQAAPPAGLGDLPSVVDAIRQVVEATSQGTRP